MSNLPADQNWEEVKKAIPPQSQAGAAPTVFFSSVPAEVIEFKGAPVYAKIPGTQLTYATNTESDLFVQTSEQKYYFLVSGRWFRSASLDGPWSYASADLPSDFAKIPPNSPASDVLASVPGTQEAQDAVLLAQIPTTAVVNIKEAEAQVKVQYDGDPQFKPIDTTQLSYATNTQDKVIKVGDIYYLCFQAVWFMSTAPTGPWKVASSVPKEIYTIPPSSPVYNVTYVTQVADVAHYGRVRSHCRLPRDVSGRGRSRLNHRIRNGLLLSALLLPPAVWVSHLSALSGHLWSRSFLQSLLRHLWCCARRLWPVWRCDRCGVVQPLNGPVWQVCLGLRSVWQCDRGAQLQPLYRCVRRDPSRFERLRQLGEFGCGTRRPVGTDRA